MQQLGIKEQVEQILASLNDSDRQALIDIMKHALEDDNASCFVETSGLYIERTRQLLDRMRPLRIITDVREATQEDIDLFELSGPCTVTASYPLITEGAHNVFTLEGKESPEGVVYEIVLGGWYHPKNHPLSEIWRIAK